jgi:hypothetical protein
MYRFIDVVSIDTVSIKRYHAGSRARKEGPMVESTTDFPNTRLELVDRSRAFVPEDRPERLAELIAGSLRERANARVHGGVV